MKSSTATDAMRISRIKKRMHWVLVLLPVLPILAFTLGAAANDALRTKSVTTESLAIVDAEGKTRAAIYVGKNKQPVFEMYNENESLLLNAGKSRDNGIGFIQFFDSDGDFKAGVGGNSKER